MLGADTRIAGTQPDEQTAEGGLLARDQGWAFGQSRERLLESSR